MSNHNYAAYYRAYRAKNRERILAQEKVRRANMTPEKHAELLAKKKAWRMRQPGYGVGRGHGNNARTLGKMTNMEKIAHRYALVAKWREEHQERVKELARNWYQKNREKKRNFQKLYIETNYQRYLESQRIKNRKYHDKTRTRPYRPIMSRRIPDFVTCPAQKRWLEKEAAVRKMNATVSFSTAIQSGLTVGRFSK